MSFWRYPGVPSSHQIEVVSDASGSIGYGAFWGTRWFNGAWKSDQHSSSIAFKELYPIVLAAQIWGGEWQRQHVLFRSDNASVVHLVNNRTSRIPQLMCLLRQLLLCAAQCNFSFSASHVPGSDNGIADALSRFHWQAFRQLAPLAQPVPDPVPTWLIALLP